MVNKEKLKKGICNALGMVGVSSIAVVSLLSIMAHTASESNAFFCQPTFEITEEDFNESSITPTSAEQRVIDNLNMTLSSNVSNGYIDIICDDGFTYPRFCWYDGNNYYSTPIVASSESNIRIQDYLYYSEQPHKHENGYFNVNNVTIDSKYDGEELTLTLIHTPLIY